MAETINGGNEIVLWLCSGIAHDEVVEHLIVGIGKEYGLDVGIVDTHMFHAVFLLITTSQFVLLDTSCLIIVGMGTNDQTVLRLAVHGLRINIIMFARILNEPAFILELLEILGSFLIDSWVVLGSANREINLGFDDVIKTHLVIASLSTCLF